MPIFWTEERVTSSGARLPYTEIRVGELTLCFRGRFGSKLREAVAELERRQGLKPLAAMAGKIRRPAEKIRQPQKPKKGPKR